MLETVTVNINAAMICFASACYPALVGKDTPIGEFQIKHYSTTIKAYGGDILAFKEEKDSIFAVHRVVDVKGQQRRKRIKSPYPSDRRFVTAGCVNVEPFVFELLVNCCRTSKIVIK